jgi:hypothetical protein
LGDMEQLAGYQRYDHQLAFESGLGNRADAGNVHGCWLAQA